jgi:hypothetical protein
MGSRRWKRTQYRLRRLGRRCAFAVAWLALILVVLEGAARLIWSQPSRLEAALASGATEITPHPTRIWGMAEGVVGHRDVVAAIGANGLRVVEGTGAPLRALTLGDSSIFGHGLSDADTLHMRLRDSLEVRGVQVDVFCGGIAGYSSEQTRVLLEEDGWDLRPDLLILGQLWSDNSYERFVDREWMDLLAGPGGIWAGPLKVSRALQWLHQLVNPPPPTDMSDIPHVGWVKKPYETGRRRVPLADYAANLDAILLAAAARDVGVIALQPANRERLAKPRGWGWDSYFDAMDQVATRRGVPVVDAVETLAGLSVDAAFLDRMHPTGEANGRYAEALAEALMAAGWPARRLVPDAGPAPFDVPLVDPYAGQRVLVRDPSDPQGDGPTELQDLQQGQ